MIQNVYYDPIHDLNEVVQTGYVDIDRLNETNMIPSNVGGNMPSFNGIEDPRSILGSPRDVFDALRMNKQLDTAAQDGRQDTNPSQPLTAENE